MSYNRIVPQFTPPDIQVIERLPMVYHPRPCPSHIASLSAWGQEAGGLPGSVRDAQLRLGRANNNQPIAEQLVCLPVEDSLRFFLRRAKQAEEAIRQRLSTIDASLIASVGQLLVRLLEHIEKIQRSVTPIHETVYSPAPIVIPTIRQPSFIDRTEERGVVHRFIEGHSGKRILVIHGHPGIGKRALLLDVQRTDHFGKDWVRSRCSPDAGLAEILGQLHIRFGVTVSKPVTLDLGTYSTLAELIAQKCRRVLVLEDAHNLPIDREHPDHSHLLEFLSVLCRSNFSPPPRTILLSDWRGHLQFASSHLLDVLPVDGLNGPDTVALLQDIISLHPSKYPPPTIAEVELVATKIHGHPLLAQMAATALETCPIDEVTEKLHEREEVRQFVMQRLLGKLSLSPLEQRFLQLASVLRIPVPSSLFSSVAGAQSRSIVSDLAKRLMLRSEGDFVILHPLLAEHFRRQTQQREDVEEYHKIAYNHYDGLCRRRSLTLDAKIELIYHAVRCGGRIDFSDLALFSGPIRSAMFEALRQRDWSKVKDAAGRILDIFPQDCVARVSTAVALDAMGEPAQAEQFVDSIARLGREDMWIGIELVRSRIRRRDFQSAERTLEELQHRFGMEPAIQLAWAQFNERQGLQPEAVALCQTVLENPACTKADAFSGGLILREANQLQVLIDAVEKRWGSDPSGHRGLERLFAYACVVTNHAPTEGLQTLSQLYSVFPDDGFVIADYAAAVSHSGRSGDARNVLNAGLERFPSGHRERRPILEQFAFVLDSCQDFQTARSYYRELMQHWPFLLHNCRRFAASLLRLAADAHTAGHRGTTDAALEEAERVLHRLLEIAPSDQWAVDALHRAEHRIF